MIDGIGQAIGEGIFRLIIVVAVVCFLLGALLTWGLPEFWGWIKPLLHKWTA